MRSSKAKIVMYATLGLGAGSLILYYLFLFLGPFTLFNFNLKLIPALVFDAIISILFFLQHSILIRKSIRARLIKHIPEVYYGAFYAITSGVALLIMIVFWQRTINVATAEGVVYWLLRLLFLLSAGGFYWGIAALGSFDPFGIRIIGLRIRNKEPKAIPLSIRGPYRWVRHPLYFFSLVMIWSCPDLTIDKLLFNIMWSAWIVIATMLEERDLMREFGDAYRKYRKQVPMLVPYKIPGR